jgi:hypothetical protein
VRRLGVRSATPLLMALAIAIAAQADEGPFQVRITSPAPGAKLHSAGSLPVEVAWESPSAALSWKLSLLGEDSGQEIELARSDQV